MTNNEKIPFLDLITPHAELKDELNAAFLEALKTAGFIGGPAVEGLEREFAAFCNARFCVGVGSGTDALRFALAAAGVKPGDSVITVPNTFIATSEAISQVGALPEFVDVEERTSTMDPERLEVFLTTSCEQDPTTGQLTSKRSGRPVTAIIPVHLYGHPADMDPILELAERYRLIVIEDACQAHGAEYFSARTNRWMKAGSMGKAAAFSFYPGKNLGACGEAGAITTNDEEIARKCRMLRDHGQAKKYYHDVEGYNGRLDAIQAALLRIKLNHLPEWNAQRRDKAQVYDNLLADLGDSIMVPLVSIWAKAVYHLYVIRVEDRDDLIAKLAADNIGTGIHYPIPLHLQVAYKHLGYKEGDFPVSERLAREIVSLPMFPNLTNEQQLRVYEALKRIFAERVSREVPSGAFAS
ncbi:MAG TPA: DegT/DnrJ/EryC1/StrS family aminotransferase [Terriglobales bacterium]|nr:DegT/DnrJ/EryC1/StrS family aminotransferase [Terriglobales bacterium]